MTKQEYLNQLKNELVKQGVADAEDVVIEYEQHFAFKLADGFGEEEISKKLGDPAAIAAQFAGLPGEKKRKGGKKTLLALWLTFIGVFELMLYAAFFCFSAALVCGAVVPAVFGVELIAGLNYLNILPPMPYSGAVIFGVALLALSVMFVIFAVYCFAYLRQMIRASLRWRKNLMKDEALPMLPMNPQFAPKTRRALRGLMLWSVLIFALTVIAGFAVLMICTNALGFWHALGWFGYPAAVH